jgi:hypothetical protein
MRKLYICNGDVPGCKKESCWYLGNGECRHTGKEEHALHGEHKAWKRMPDGSFWEVDAR